MLYNNEKFQDFKKYKFKDTNFNFADAYFSLENIAFIMI